MISPADLALPLRRARQQLGREINPTAYTAAEFEKKRIGADPFLKQVLDKPRIFVLGNNHDLGKVAGG
jgi:hypothetical protein